MSEQLTLALFDTIAVEPTRDVLLRGADAISGGVFLFTHHHVPARPATVTGDRVWLAMLDLAEDARRYNHAGRAVLDLTARNGAGSNGPIGTGDLMLDGKGCENWRDKSRATDLSVMPIDQLGTPGAALIVAVIGITSLRIFTTGPNGGTCMLAARSGSVRARDSRPVRRRKQVSR